MDSIWVTEYRSEGGFRIYDWEDETLLIRRQGSLYVGGDIDLIFWGVKYLALPLVLPGVRVSKPRDEKALLCEQKYAPDPFAEPGARVYRIESGGNVFHIISSNLWVLTNKTHVRESSLAHLISQDEELREGYFREHVSQWYKIR